MRIAIVGGTGTLDRHVSTELAERGHEVRVLSRSSQRYPVDLASGEGLRKALDGCAAGGDASNASSPRRAAQVLVAGSRRLLTAEQQAGVSHHVCVSIVGCERVSMGYYRVKVAQDQLVEQVAEGQPGRGRVQVAGPEITSARELARTWRSVTGRAAPSFPLPMPGKLGRELRAAGLTTEHADVRGTIRFADWLTARQRVGS
jgi:uncharacterized protein YbjT (DUF2867 family)